MEILFAVFAFSTWHTKWTWAKFKVDLYEFFSSLLCLFRISFFYYYSLFISFYFFLGVVSMYFSLLVWTGKDEDKVRTGRSS